ncbi:hypothetical protein [Hwanghaeella sp.]|uniref:hypothetical protein n=1 Tax=Hwanghaeella sp. TaxID=2605943 RepID=UPI003CCC2F68
MPVKYKLLISFMVVIAAAVTFYFQSKAGEAVTPWVALGLGAFMIFSMWVFPEEQKKKK